MLTGMQRAAARGRLRRSGAGAGPLPHPDLAAGTDTLAQIEHIVVLMMENHSYDNYLGMLAGHGDTLPLDAQGRPTPTNPDQAGRAVPMLHFPSTVQHKFVPTQSWHASHIQYAGGACDGFVRSVEQTEPAGVDATVPMGYWTEADIPFYYGLARTFPLATRWFCSCLGPTFPNRRFLIAATANGLIDDLPFGMIARQAEVLGLLASGMSNKEIAGALFLSPATVERHLATIYRKLGLSGRVEATRYAIRAGLATPTR
jgi:phospholipase C